ncbi:hypothetical protein [Paraburkholderia sacchari]|uniref:hypothetical protein n=1 Tax=Paraburkholderia sacchari TaxID=159450 RepID=UPI0039A451B0
MNAATQPVPADWRERARRCPWRPVDECDHSPELQWRERQRGEVADDAPDDL